MYLLHKVITSLDVFQVLIATPNLRQMIKEINRSYLSICKPICFYSAGTGNDEIFGEKLVLFFHFWEFFNKTIILLIFLEKFTFYRFLRKK